MRTSLTRVSADAVRRVVENPPRWLSGSYLQAYRDGRLSVEVLALGVVAAYGGSVHDQEALDVAMSTLVGMGYGDEVAAVLV